MSTTKPSPMPVTIIFVTISSNITPVTITTTTTTRNITTKTTSGQSCQFSGTFDPCYGGNNKPFPYMSDRCPDCDYLSNDRSDLYDLDHDTWYITAFNMTTRYVSPSGCGTRIPIWLNGTIPMIGEGVVSRTACLATFQELCASSYSIKVKRCDSSYTVYCLDNLPSSVQQRYCFDFDPSVFTTTTSTTSAKLPTTEPPKKDREGIHIFNDTGVQSWVTAVIACLSITIVVLVAIIVVVYRQFRKNHKRYRTFPYNDMPPPYNQVIGFIPIHEKELTSVVNVKTRY